jgi:hypothetical protein
MLFEEMISVYGENHRKAISTQGTFCDFKADGANSYRWASKG